MLGARLELGTSDFSFQFNIYFASKIQIVQSQNRYSSNTTNHKYTVVCCMLSDFCPLILTASSPIISLSTTERHISYIHKAAAQKPEPWLGPGPSNSTQQRLSITNYHRLSITIINYHITLSITIIQCRLHRLPLSITHLITHYHPYTNIINFFDPLINHHSNLPLIHKFYNHP